MTAHPTLTGMAAAGFRSAADFYYASQLLAHGHSRDSAAAQLAAVRVALDGPQWAYVERHAGVPPTGQLTLDLAP